MKKTIIATLLVACLAFISCEQFLEITPRDRISDANMTASTATADLYLNSVYAGVLDQYSLPSWEYYYFYTHDHFTDQVLAGINVSPARNFNQGAITPTYNWDCIWYMAWQVYFSSIRGANLFIERVSDSGLDADWKELRIAEARFLRAYFYANLFYYGEVPIITDVLNLSEQGDAIFREQNTAEEVVQFVIDECDAIYNSLPLKAAERGRATRGAALMLKASAELWFASPLMNPSNDKNRWAAAASSYRQVINLGVYDLFPDQRTLFLEENDGNQETIFARSNLGGAGGLGSAREGVYAPGKVGGSSNSYSGSHPTKSMVDSYFMANGLPIDDPASGYNPQDPYTGREKRFYNDIIYNGTVWQGRTAQFQMGGIDQLNVGDDGSHNTLTGYFQKKLMNEKYVQVGEAKISSADFIIYRLGEALLGYAEAQNEAVGPDASVYEAVDRVRARVDLPGLKAGLAQDQMREAVRRERAVELAFECKRYWDILRWKTAETVLNQPVQATRIEIVDGTPVYSTHNAAGGTRVFDAGKHYRWPIPQGAIDLNSKLKQNPGYN